jgi:hypothetical protein
MVQLEKIIFFFIKNYHLPIPRPPERTSKLQKSLQPSKENSDFFLLLWVIFALLDPNPDPDSKYGSGSTDPIESGSAILVMVMAILIQFVRKRRHCFVRYPVLKLGS